MSRSLFTSVDEEDDYECVTVINSHTQDVKHIVWHPNQEVSPTQLEVRIIVQIVFSYIMLVYFYSFCIS